MEVCQSPDSPSCWSECCGGRHSLRSESCSFWCGLSMLTSKTLQHRCDLQSISEPCAFRPYDPKPCGINARSTRVDSLTHKLPTARLRCAIGFGFAVLSAATDAHYIIAKSMRDSHRCTYCLSQIQAGHWHACCILQAINLLPVQLLLIAQQSYPHLLKALCSLLSCLLCIHATTAKHLVVVCAATLAGCRCAMLPGGIAAVSICVIHAHQHLFLQIRNSSNQCSNAAFTKDSAKLPSIKLMCFACCRSRTLFQHACCTIISNIYLLTHSSMTNKLMIAPHKCYTAMLHCRSAADDALVDQIIASTQHPQALDAFVSILFAPMSQLSFEQMIQAMQCPVCMVYGREDPWVVPLWGQRLKRLLDDAVYLEVSGTGRCLHQKLVCYSLTLYC